MDKDVWESMNAWTRRQPVPGGWLYQIATELGERTVDGEKQPPYALSWHPPVFVPGK